MADNNEQQPASRWVRITSNDGYSFIVDRKVAQASPHFADALSGGFSESNTNTVHLDDARAVVAEKVVEYLCYKAQWEGVKGPIPDFSSRVPPEIALELMMVADYLHS